MGGSILAHGEKTFESYLQDTQYNAIFAALKSYIYKNRQRLNLSTRIVPDPDYPELDDIHVMGVTFKEGEGDCICFRAAVQTDVILRGKGHRDYEEDMVTPWFTVAFSGILHNGLSNVRILGVDDYSRERFDKEDALTKYLVPYVYAKDLDEHATKFLEKYCPRALKTAMPLPLDEILEAMQLKRFEAPLPDNIFGQTFFSPAHVQIIDERTGEVVEMDIEPGTIQINPNVVFMRNIGSNNNTIIHECVHWDKHHKFFELQQLLNPGISTITCAVVEKYDKLDDGSLASELDWMEWQANALAPRILMPASTTKQKLTAILRALHQAFPNTRDAEIMQLAISQLADFFQVSTVAAKIRAVELGFDQAAGVFNYVDGTYHEPFSFKRGTLKKNQTFVVDRNNAIMEGIINPEIAQMCRSSLIVHADGVFAINNPKFVTTKDDGSFILTDYALDHADECCLVFTRKTRVSKQYDDSYYRICFLCRDPNSESFVEATCDIHEEHNENIKHRAEEMGKIRDESDRLQEIADELPTTFHGTLNKHIERRGYTNEDMEERTYISARSLIDYRNKRVSETNPELPTVLALCVALNLHPLFSYDLIKKAGYDVMSISPVNCVYQYLINNHHMECVDMWNRKLRDAGITQVLPSNRNQKARDALEQPE